MPDRPKHMCRSGRQDVPPFRDDECFYHRVAPDFAKLVGEDGRIDAHHFGSYDCIDLSSNRSLLSEAWYVLYPRSEFGEWAVFKFRRQDLPAKIQRETKDSAPYEVRTEPDPFDENFGHCETRVYRGSIRMRKNQVKQDGKNKLRLSLSRALTLAREAGIPFPPEGWVEPPVE
jgi:hypothetical protein